MGVAIAAPRGGLAEKLGPKHYPLLLSNAEIERFEDQHRGIFDIWDGFFGRATKPNSTEVRDLVALGLIGAGMKDADADAFIAALGPDHSQHLYSVSLELLGVAFHPDSVEGGGDELDSDVSGETGEKKTDPAPGE